MDGGMTQSRAPAKKTSMYKARLLAYLCLGFALALAVPPFFAPDSSREYQTRPAVYLSARTTDPALLNAWCKEQTVDLSDRDLDSYPDLKKAVDALRSPAQDRSEACFKSEDPARLARKAGRTKAARFCFTHKGGAYLLILKAPFTGNSCVVQVGADPDLLSMAAELLPDEAAAYPCLKSYLDGLRNWVKQGVNNRTQADELRDQLQALKEKKPASKFDEATRAFKEIEIKQKLKMLQIAGYRHRVGKRPSYEEQRSEFELDQWRPLLERIGFDQGRKAVRIGEYVIKISLRDYSEWVVTRHGNISLARIVCGAVLLLLGAWLLWPVYGPKPGMAINALGSVIFADVLFGLAMGVLSAGPLDYALERWLGLLPLLDEALMATLSLMYLPCLFILAGMAANMGGQSLEVNGEGVIWHGPGSSRFLDWNQIIGLKLRDSHVPVGRMGILLPRRLQTKLVFDLADNSDVELFEPGTRRRKEAILDSLEQNAPERLRPDLKSIRQQW